MTTRTVFRTCTLCEACCGLAIDVEGDRITAVRGDPDDVMSHGFVCPKGVAIGEIHHDPDRLRGPVRRTPAGDFEPIGWEEAFTLTAERLRAVRARHGGDAIAFYAGNPIGHNLVSLLLGPFAKSLGTRNRYSSNSQDINPRIVASYLLYGASWAVPVPDVDRTQYLLCLGANPLASNGSMLTAPDVRGRLHAIRARGGKVVVVDPRRTETARIADEHVSIRPGGDAALLLAMVAALQQDGHIDEARLARTTTGWATIRERLAAFAPERVVGATGIPADTIRRLAREFVAAPSSVAYSRVGVCQNEHATLASWATDLLNLAAGRLGVEGGALFPEPAIDLALGARFAGLDGWDRWRSRVRQMPETIGDLPSTTLADEIETPGRGQVKALVTLAGNPVLSIPNGKRLDALLPTLDFRVAIDLYVNETTRHADVILPPAWSLADDHVDVVFPMVAARNFARWSPALVERRPDERHDWEIVLELCERLGGGPYGMGPLDAGYRVARRFGLRWSPWPMVDFFLRTGPHGDRYLPWSKGLNLARLKTATHGIDFGALRPGLERRLYHRDRRIHLAPEPIVGALDALARQLDAEAAPLVLIGRRDLRTNNSWMHNAPSMVTGRDRCVLLVHPDDARAAGVRDGGTAILESRIHRGEVHVRITDDVRPGVVSLPHGWGHASSARWQRVAGAHAGVSVNDWVDDAQVEAVVGQSVMNGVPVRLHGVAS